MVSGLNSNFIIASMDSDNKEFGELYMFNWTTFLIPLATLIVINIVGVIAGMSDALHSSHIAWGLLSVKVLFVLWVTVHLNPFLKGRLRKKNRTPVIAVMWSVLLGSVFLLCQLEF